jgi:hypothetical protein
MPFTFLSDGSPFILCFLSSPLACSELLLVVSDGAPLASA